MSNYALFNYVGNLIIKNILAKNLVMVISAKIQGAEKKFT